MGHNPAMAAPPDPERLEGAFVMGRRVVQGWITVGDGRITGIGSSAPGVHAGGERIAAPAVIAPGLIDVHIHGSGGASALGGSAEVEQLALVLGRRGVTAFLPTSVSAPLPDLLAFLGAVRAARQGEPGGSPRSALRARILGANLEGPAIDPGHRGAHDPASIIAPADLLDAWRANPAAWSEARIVTIAPERPGGLELVRHLAANGVVASLGHSGATFEQARAAYAAGARSTTHLFNAMTGLGHRAPGVVGSALDDGRALVELIADGVHVDRAIWPIVWRTVGSRLLLVSDAIEAAGRGDGSYKLGPIAVTVTNGRATTPGGALAGSTISVADAVANLVAAGLALPRAVGAATRAPARLLGRRDVGRIAVGALADLVVLDPAGRVKRTMIGGRWLDPAD
jgi:N-acetylglucosamine-6-phosphate deacetylase